MIRYEEVKPWGRSMNEYQRMFSLRAADLRLRILGCGDGPASFNQELSAAGGTVVSVDPIYEFDAEQIRQRIDATYESVLAQTAENREKFVWDGFESVEELGRCRMAAMLGFLSDFERGKRDGRYLVGTLPHLSFADGSFELALCSHLLFLYSDLLDEDFHFDSIVEMVRVAGETRVFPLLAYDGTASAHLPSVVARLRQAGHHVSIERVSYEFQCGGNEMLRVIRGT